MIQFSSSNVQIVKRKVCIYARSLQSFKDVSRRLIARFQRASASPSESLDCVQLRCRTRPVSVDPATRLMAALVGGGRLLAYIPFPEWPLLLDIRYRTHYCSDSIWNRSHCPKPSPSQ
ncbi:uncharacterized protein ARMOST_14417 [Armillaria ostoyae]|uniref:Uncharacterized protein n=1 Tax=Armillaria ostoyae TaxID=47428 RepID=A0A284RQH5_ARMOS|nr:uncharacterized protein ARMOST_14417 [Armillaria ostoyae]